MPVPSSCPLWCPTTTMSTPTTTKNPSSSSSKCLLRRCNSSHSSLLSAGNVFSEQGCVISCYSVLANMSFAYCELCCDVQRSCANVSPSLSSFLKLYTTMPVAKLAGFLDMTEQEFRIQLLVFKHKMKNLVWTSGISALDGEFQSASEVDFYIDKVGVCVYSDPSHLLYHMLLFVKGLVCRFWP